MNTNERKIITNRFDRLYRIADNRGWNNPVKQVFEIERKDEKQHRGNDAARFNCTVTEAAKYFTVKHIFDGITQRHDVKDILHIRLACYYGEAIAHEFSKEIAAEFTADEIAEFLTLDYVKIIE